MWGGPLINGISAKGAPKVGTRLSVKQEWALTTERVSTATKGPRSQSVSERVGDKTIFLHSIRKSLHDPLSRPPDGLHWTADSLF